MLSFNHLDMTYSFSKSTTREKSSNCFTWSSGSIESREAFRRQLSLISKCGALGPSTPNLLTFRSTNGVPGHAQARLMADVKGVYATAAGKLGLSPLIVGRRSKCRKKTIELSAFNSPNTNKACAFLPVRLQVQHALVYTLETHQSN